jgi:hypothetical protein
LQNSVKTTLYNEGDPLVVGQAYELTVFLEALTAHNLELKGLQATVLSIYPNGDYEDEGEIVFNSFKFTGPFYAINARKI